MCCKEQYNEDEKNGQDQCNAFASGDKVLLRATKCLDLSALGGGLFPDFEIQYFVVSIDPDQALQLARELLEARAEVERRAPTSGQDPLPPKV